MVCNIAAVYIKRNYTFYFPTETASDSTLFVTQPDGFITTSAVLHVYICLYNRADIDDICVCLYLFISDLACLYNGMFISGYRRLYLDMDLYICSYNRHI